MPTEFGLRPGAKAPDEPPTSYRLRASPRLYSWRSTSTSGPGDAPATSLGFALQLCVLRYPGRLLTPGEFVPPAVVDFIGRQLDLDGGRTCRLRGAVRDQARASLPTCAGCTDSNPSRGRAARELGDRLREEAQRARSNDVADRIKELLPRLEAELDHLRNTVKELFR